jgi:hypothetical protein
VIARSAAVICCSGSARTDAALSLRSDAHVAHFDGVNKPEKDDPSILDEIVLGVEAAE